jgi:hypothetical protein
MFLTSEPDHHADNIPVVPAIRMCEISNSAATPCARASTFRACRPSSALSTRTWGMVDVVYRK